MTPSPATPQPSKLTEILQAILAGLQIAAEALPVVQQYQTVFGGATNHLVAPIVSQATTAHPVTGAIVQTLLTPPAPPAAAPAGN